MKPEMNFQLNPNEKGQVELVVREGAAVKVLDPKAPLPFKLQGTLESVKEFLGKRVNSGQFDQKNCYIVVDRENLSITLNFNERDEYTNGIVHGYMQYHPDFELLGINSQRIWTPADLAMEFKMHRHWFENISENMRLVSELKNFVANVNAKVEKTIEENGSRSDVFSQVVDSNLPKSFTLNLPIVRGGNPVAIEVETFARVDGKQVAFCLISPGAVEVVNDVRNNVINSELDAIRTIAPEIVIIEK